MVDLSSSLCKRSPEGISFGDGWNSHKNGVMTTGDGWNWVNPTELQGSSQAPRSDSRAQNSMKGRPAIDAIDVWRMPKFSTVLGCVGPGICPRNLLPT